MKEIKSVIFDWGGVLIDNPRPALLQYCTKALGTPVEDYAEIHDRLLDDFQKRLLSEAALSENICTELTSLRRLVYLFSLYRINRPGIVEFVDALI